MWAIQMVGQHRGGRGCLAPMSSWRHGLHGVAFLWYGCIVHGTCMLLACKNRTPYTKHVQEEALVKLLKSVPGGLEPGFAVQEPVNEEGPAEEPAASSGGAAAGKEPGGGSAVASAGGAPAGARALKKNVSSVGGSTRSLLLLPSIAAKLNKEVGLAGLAFCASNVLLHATSSRASS